MAEQTTTAESPVEQSIDDRIAAKFGLTEEPQEAPEAEAQPDPVEDVPSEPQDPEILSPDEVQPETSDELELTHNGRKIRVPKEEAIKLAQQGYDYTQKTQTLAEERKQIEAEKAAVRLRGELSPKLIEAAGKFEAVRMQLEAYQSVDWAALAAQDPTNYPAHHANYTKLTQQANAAWNEFQKIQAGVQQADKTINEAEFAKSWNLMLERIPGWRDEKRRVAEQKKVGEYLKSEDFSDDDLSRLTDPRWVSVARKAALYDEALKARSEKTNQIKQAPAVKPGAAQPAASPQAKKADLVKQLHQAKDPARKKALFDEVLAAKFGLK